MFSHITYLPAFQPKTKCLWEKIITHHIPKKTNMYFNVSLSINVHAA